MNNLADRVYRLFSWKNQHLNPTNTQNNQNVDEYEISSSNIGNSCNDGASSSILNNSRRQNSCNSNNSTSNSRCELINLSESNSSESRRSSSSLSRFTLSSQNGQEINNRNESSLTIQPNRIENQISQHNNNNNNNNHDHLQQLQPLLTTSNTNNNNNSGILSFLVNNSNNNSSSTNSRRRHHRSSRSHRSSSRRHVNNQPNSLQLLLQNSFNYNNNGNSNSNNNNTNNSNSNSSTNSNVLYDLFSLYKKRERNLLSACCSVFCITILAISLVETRWFYLNGGGCNVNYIGVAHFFSPGRLEYQIEISKVTKSEIIVYNFVLPSGQVLKNCANREILIIMRTVIAFVFLAIFSSCLGLILDTIGCMHLCFKLTRRHAIFHVLTVILCLAINGFCFWISERMAEQQFETRLKKGKKIDVSFDVSYYLIVLASGMSILATAFTLIRRYSSDEDEQLERLLEEYTGFEDPIHLERSLPAQTIVNQANLMPSLIHNPCQDCYLSNNVRRPQQPPPPPSTPPPSLHQTNLINLDINNNEPPPPYDPIPAIA